MTISMSSYASTIGRLVAENAIASEEANRRILHAGHTANQGQIEIQNSKQEQANGLRSAMAYIEMAQSGYKAAAAAVSAGQAVAAVPEAAKADTELHQGLEGAKGGDRAALEAVRLGDEGPCVGERFNAKQLDVLTRGEKFNSSAKELEQMGFSRTEARELAARGKDGLTKDEAARFMWDHRATQEATDKAHIREKLQAALIEEPLKGISRGLGQDAKRCGDEGKRAAETGSAIEEVADRMRDATSRHFKALDGVELDAIRRRGENKGSSTV